MAKPKKPETTEQPVQLVEPDDKVSKLISSHVTHTTTGLIFDDKLQFEDWMEVYKFYQGLNNKSQWFLGDVLRHGSRYGERYTQAIELGKSTSYLSSLVSVCERFSDLTRRRAGLSFEHHASVAYLLPQTADAILDDAEKKGWDRDDVRDAAAKAKGLPTKAQKEAAKKLAEESQVKLLPAAELPLKASNGNAPIDVETTSTPVPPAPPAPVWNGYPVTSENGLLFAGDAVPLDDQEADRCAHEHGHANAEAMVAALSSSGAQEARQQASAPAPATLPTPEPQKPAQPAATPAEDQHVAIQRMDAALQRFLEAIREVDTTQIKKPKAQSILKEMIEVDKFIDVLSKIE